MRLIASGKTVSQIATELSLSVKTVSTYRARILEKLKMSNNADIIRYAMTRGLVQCRLSSNVFCRTNPYT